MRILNSGGAGVVGDAIKIREFVSNGGQTGRLFAFGTWGGATLTLEISPDGQNWAPYPDISITANGTAVLDTVANTTIRAILTGGDGTTSVNVDITG